MKKIVQYSFLFLLLILKPTTSLPPQQDQEKEEEIEEFELFEKENKKKSNKKKEYILISILLGVALIEGSYLIYKNYNSEEQSHRQNEPIPTPKKIFEDLHKNVIGQEAAKKKMAILLHNHLQYKKDILSHKKEDPVYLPKVNMMIQGSSGSGKTFLTEQAAKLGKIPFIIVKINNTTPEGIVGQGIQDAIARQLFSLKGFTREELKFAIVAFDEMDKISAKRSDGSEDKQKNTLQDELLSIIEGKATVCAKKSSGHQDHARSISTEHMLFIGIGAFTDVSQHFRRNNISMNSIQLRKYLSDHKNFKVELLARFQSWAFLDELSEDDLINIMNQPENAIVKQYQKLMTTCGKQLHFTDGAVRHIQQKTHTLGLGARGLTSILQKVLEPYIFTIDTQPHTITITEGNVNQVFSENAPSQNEEE